MEFPITASPTSAIWVAGIIAVITLAMGGLFTWFAFTTSSLSTAIDNDALTIRVPFYGRSIPLSNLELEAAQIVDLNQSEHKPTTRTNGIGLPGYAVGWFRLQNGEKALAAITSRDKVLYVPTTEGYALLLSLNDPNTFLSHARDGVTPTN